MLYYVKILINYLNLYISLDQVFQLKCIYKTDTIKLPALEI